VSLVFAICLNLLVSTGEMALDAVLNKYHDCDNVKINIQLKQKQEWPPQSSIQYSFTQHISVGILYINFKDNT